MIRSRALIGAGAAVVATVLFTLNDTIIKLVSGQYPLMQVVLIWTVFSTLFLLGLIIPLTDGHAGLRTQRPLLHLARGLCVVVSNFSFFFAVASMPLADAVAVFFVAPLLITAASVLFLGERVRALQWVAVLIGLLGVGLIAKPGTEAFTPISLLPLLAALTYAGLQILTRSVGETESKTALTFYIQVTFLVVCSVGGLWLGDGHLAGSADPSVAFLLRPWIWPPVGDLGFFLALGFSSAAGGMLISQAYRVAPAALVAPFEYVGLPMSVLWGILVFGDWPDRLALLGMGLIVLAGLLAIWRDAERGAVDPAGGLA